LSGYDTIVRLRAIIVYLEPALRRVLLLLLLAKGLDSACIVVAEGDPELVFAPDFPVHSVAEILNLFGFWTFPRL
jgi:hypothetical protein